MTINAELRPRPDRSGLCTIRFCLQDRGKRKYYPVPIKILPKHWDTDKQKVRSSHPQAVVYNQILMMKRIELMGTAVNGSPNATDITFVAYATACLNKWEKVRANGTIRAYQSMLKCLKRFDKDRKQLTAIDSIWLSQYEQFSREEGVNNPGVLKRLSFVCKVINTAIADGILASNPFAVYKKPAKVNPPRVWLTMAELDTMERYLAGCSIAPLRNAGYWFLMSCYSGLRYSDCQGFNPDVHVQDNRLILYTQKTGDIVSIAIHSRLQNVLGIVAGIGPVMSNQKANYYLKHICRLAGIHKDISFHSARHTFAVQCANLGISQEVVARLLGHSDLKVTAIYYKIVNSRVDGEMAKWG